VAIEHLTRIVADPASSVRQRLKAISILLNYRTDHDTTEFARAFLERVVSDPDISVDYKLEGLELLRRSQGDPMLRPSIEKLTPSTPPRDREAEEAERRRVAERRKRHLEEQSIKDRERLRQEWKEHGWQWPDDSPA
jgi:hypothetical protein